MNRSYLSAACELAVQMARDLFRFADLIRRAERRSLQRVRHSRRTAVTGVAVFAVTFATFSSAGFAEPASATSSSSQPVLALPAMAIGSSCPQNPIGPPTPSADTIAYVAEASVNSIQMVNESTGALIGSPIPVGTNPTGMAYWEPYAGSSHDPEVIVANTGSNSVSVVDAVSRTVVATISLPTSASPSGVSASWSNTYAVVVDRGIGKVSIINLLTNTDAGEISLSGSANTLLNTAFTAFGGYAYVSDPTQHKIFVLSYSGGSAPYFTQLTTYVHSAYNPTSFAVNYSNSASQGLLVSSPQASSGDVLMFNDNSGTLTTPTDDMHLSTWVPTSVAFGAGTTYAYTSLSGLKNVLQFNIPSGSSVATQNMAFSSFTTAAGPIAMSADGATIMTADTGSAKLQGDLTTTYTSSYLMSAAATITAIVPAFPLSGSWNAYVLTNSSAVDVVNTGTNTVVQAFTDSSGPSAEVASPDGQYIYIANSNGSGSSISVVSTALIGLNPNPILTTFTVPQGTEPSLPVLNGIAISPSGDALLVTDYANGAVDVIGVTPGSTPTLTVTARIGLGGFGINSTSQTTSGAVTFSPDGLFAYVSEFGNSGTSNDGVTVLQQYGSTYSFDAMQTGLFDGASAGSSTTLIAPKQLSVSANGETMFVEGSTTAVTPLSALFSFPIGSNGQLGSYSGVTPVTQGATASGTIFDPQSNNSYSVSASADTLSSLDIGNSTMYGLADTAYGAGIAINRGSPATLALSPDGLYLAVATQHVVVNGCGSGNNSIQMVNPATGVMGSIADVGAAPIAITFAPQSTPNTLTLGELAGGANNPSEAAVSGINDVVSAGTPSNAPGVSAGVDTATGTYSMSLDSMNVTNLGLNLNQAATYDSSLSSTTGLLGKGWTNSYGVTVSQSAYGGSNSCVVTAHQEDGSTVTFTPLGSFSACSNVARFQAPGWVESTLSYQSTNCVGTDGCFVLTRQASTSYTIDSVTGQLAKETDLHNNSVTISWGAHGSTCPGATASQPCQVLGADGHRALTYSYPSPGSGTCPSGVNSCVVVTDPIGRTVTYEENASGQLVDVTLALGAQSSSYAFSYNAAGQLAQWCDPTEFAAGNCPGTSPYSTSITYASGVVTSVTGPNTQMANVGVALPTLETPSAPTTTFTRLTFDVTTGDGTVLVANPDFTASATSPGANETLDTYENFQLVSSILGYGALSTYGVTENAPDVRPSTFTPAVSATVMRDSLNLMPEEVMDAMAGAQPSNGTSGATSAVSAYDYGVTFTNYDANANAVSSTDGLGNTTVTTFNSLDEPLTVTDPFGNVTTNTYNAVGDLLTTTSPGNAPAATSETSSFYNANGTICASRDADQVANSGVLSSCVAAGNNATVYSYSSTYPEDQTLATTQGVSSTATTQNVYDVGGNLCATLTPDGYLNGPLSGCPSVATPYATVDLALNQFAAPTEVITSSGPSGSSVTYTCTDQNGGVFESVGPAGSAPNCAASSWPVTTALDTAFTGTNYAGESVFAIAPIEVSGTQGATTVTGYDLSANTILTLSSDGYSAWAANHNATLTSYEQAAIVSNTGTSVGSGPETEAGQSCFTSATSPCAEGSVALSDPNGATTTTSSTTSNGTGVITSTSLYDANGSVTSATSPVNGTMETTLTFYDAQGNAWANETSLGTTFSSSSFVSGTESSFAPSARVCWTAPLTAALASNATEPSCTGSIPVTATVNYYDSNGQTIAKVGPGGAGVIQPGGPCSPLAAVATAYTLLTNRICAFTTYYVYNQAGQLAEVAQPSASSSTAGSVTIGATTTYTYDASGNQVTATNPLGVTTTRAYNSAGQVIGLSYSSGGNSVCTVGATSYAVCYSYNADGSRASMTSSAGSFTYGYSTQGQLTSETDGNGATVSFGYNANGQQDCVSYPNATTTCANYTSGTVPSSGSGLVGYTYNAEGQLASVLDSNGDAFTYGYDCAGDVLFMVESPSSAIPSVSDCAVTGSNPTPPSSTTGGATDVITTYGYSNATNGGQLLYQSTAALSGSTSTPLLGFNSVTSPFTYNGDGTLASSTPIANGTAQATDSFVYDNQRRVTSGPEAGSGTLNYTYVNSASQPGSFTTSKTVDQMGLASSAQGTSATGSQYAGSGEICWTESATVSTLSNPSQNCTTPGNSAYVKYAYDAAGNRVSATANGYGSNSAYTWNQATGTLACVNPTGSTCSGPSGSTPNVATYTYSPDNLRLTANTWNSSTSSVQTTNFAWNMQTSALLSDGTHNYVYGLNPNVPIAQINLGDATTSELVTDQSSNVRGVVEVTPGAHAYQLNNYTDYDSYGSPVTASGGSQNIGGLTKAIGLDADSATSFGFGGGFTDATGLVYFVNRYYDPASGQFISVDPMVETTGTPYAYVNDNPISFIDSLGLCSFLDCIGSAVGSALSTVGSGIVTAWNYTGGAVVHGINVLAVNSYHLAGQAVTFALHQAYVFGQTLVNAASIAVTITKVMADSAIHWVGRHWRGIVSGLELGAAVACTFVSAGACGIVAGAVFAADTVVNLHDNHWHIDGNFMKAEAFAAVKAVVLAIPGGIAERGLSLASKSGQLAFTRLQSAFVRIMTGGPGYIDQVVTHR